MSSSTSSFLENLTGAVAKATNAATGAVGSLIPGNKKNNTKNGVNTLVVKTPEGSAAVITPANAPLAGGRRRRRGGKRKTTHRKRKTTHRKRKGRKSTRRNNTMRRNTRRNRRN
jgi:hypothetical protein